jgi:UDP-N-acetylmuramate dehydrogenase
VKALIQENVPLAPFTTFRIGGPARYFIDASSEESVLDAVQFAQARNVPLFVLGGGSNLLVADAGFAGVVVKVSIGGVEWHSDTGRTVVKAGAGEDWDTLVAACVERSLAGIECLSGIPGSVGGTPVQNVGAYGQEISEVFAGLRAYDCERQSVVEFSRDDCGFAYRTSRFNTTDLNRFIVLQVTYSLSHDRAPVIRYPDVQREFENHKSPPSLAEVRGAVRRIRARKAMLIVEGDPDCRSTGSFFKNPTLTEERFRELQAHAGPSLPRYPAAAGKVKTAAAWLIEQAGFTRGYSIGAAGVSTKHTLALVNNGGAKAEDILRLARQIRMRVHDKFGVTLIPEPVLLGFDHAIETEFKGA